MEPRNARSGSLHRQQLCACMLWILGRCRQIVPPTRSAVVGTIALLPFALPGFSRRFHNTEPLTPGIRSHARYAAPFPGVGATNVVIQLMHSVKVVSAMVFSAKRVYLSPARQTVPKGVASLCLVSRLRCRNSTCVRRAPSMSCHLYCALHEFEHF